MTFRDDLGAAHARIDELERELSDAQGTNESLRRELEEARNPRPTPTEMPWSGKLPRVATAGADRAAQGRRLAYREPWSYFPLWLRLWAGMRFASRYRLPRPKSDGLLEIIVHWTLVRPFFYGVLLPLFFFLAVPWVAVIALFTTPFFVLGKAMAGLKFTRDASLPREPRPGGLDDSEEPVISIGMTFAFTAPLAVSIVSNFVGRGS